MSLPAGSRTDAGVDSTSGRSASHSHTAYSHTVHAATTTSGAGGTAAAASGYYQAHAAAAAAAGARQAGRPRPLEYGKLRCVCRGGVGGAEGAGPRPLEYSSLSFLLCTCACEESGGSWERQQPSEEG
eukprot:352436-Chlamydomonas_euryale.AAC.2